MVEKFRAFYETYQETFYFIAVNVFAAFVIVLYIWNTDSENLFDNKGIITIAAVLWLVMNAYFLKVSISDGRRKISDL